ncbi:hypothetical protein JXQ70_15175 [bacterium]|nr:hypothetical protein [bacterium]
MAKPTMMKILSGIIVFILISLIAYWPSHGKDSTVYWFSIIPPLVAIILAFVLKQIHFSLFVAVLLGGLLVKVPADPLRLENWTGGLGQGFQFILASLCDWTNIQILAFVVLVMTMISVLLFSGGLQGIINWLERYARSKRSAQFITVIMGLVIFIDDYANTMLVGSAMRPITDRYRISRAKLAYLVDSTSAPVAGLAIISTWIGYEVGLFNDVAQTLPLEHSGYSLFFDALHYRYYCFMCLLFVLVNVISGVDFGAMHRLENTGSGVEPVPCSTGTLQIREPDIEIAAVQIQGRARTAIIPLVALFTVLLTGLWFDGGGFDKLYQDPWSLVKLTVWQEVLSNSENNIMVLAISALIGLISAVIMAFTGARLSARIIFQAMTKGITGSLLPITILVLAWSLKNSCDALLTGQFLAEAIGSVLSASLFPVILFFVAGVTSFATGTSWGTMAILIPTAIPLAFILDGSSYGLTTMICLGAVLDGAIFGDHCSPISDTTIMSSIFSGCDHLDHVRTQLPYSLIVAIAALLLGYLPAALGLPCWAGLIAALFLFSFLFYVIKHSRFNIRNRIPL